MTRETKIGLLVGLAFIIVIGILLSDHMTSTTEPPKATLAGAGNNVRQSIGSPAASEAPAIAAVAPGLPVTPSQVVPTREEVVTPAGPARPPVQNIQVGPGPGQALAQGPVLSPVQSYVPAPSQTQYQPRPLPQPPVMMEAAAGDVPNSPIASAPRMEPATGNPLLDRARQRGEDLVIVGPNGPPSAPRLPVTPTPTALPAAPQPARARQYKAEPGDNLTKMAAKLFGASNKANRDAIVKANPSLRQNPDRIIVGRSYNVPEAPAANVAPAAPVPTAVRQAAVTPASDSAGASDEHPARAASASTPPVTPATSQSRYWYTVKGNDNLWKIAAEQMGSGNAWLELKELNKDVLKGGDTVQPNMRLRLPGKPVASAN